MDQKAHMEMPLNCESAKYQARAWRTDVLKTQAVVEITKMLQAFVPEGFTVKIEECDAPVPGYPFAPNYKFRAILRDKSLDGSDAHINVFAYSYEGVQAELLAAIVDGQGFFPLT